LANPFQGLAVLYVMAPGLSLRSNPELKLANAFGVFKVNQYAERFSY
jgi:hypothetical protein